VKGNAIILEIRNGRLRWLGHVEKTSGERTVKTVFKIIPEAKWPFEEPRKR
jgi:hypothetical protein